MHIYSLHYAVYIAHVRDFDLKPCFLVPKVKAILVNIFGGIVDCTIIANGIVGACREIQLTMPLVVRLEGVCVCVCDCVSE